MTRLVNSRVFDFQELFQNVESNIRNGTGKMSLVGRATLKNRKSRKANQFKVILRKSDKVAKTGNFYIRLSVRNWFEKYRLAHGLA